MSNSNKVIKVIPAQDLNAIVTKLQVLELARQNIQSARRIISRMKQDLRSMGQEVVDLPDVDGGPDPATTGAGPGTGPAV